MSSHPKMAPIDGLAATRRGTGPQALEVTTPLRRARKPDPLGRGRRHLGPPFPDGNL